MKSTWLGRFKEVARRNQLGILLGLMFASTALFVSNSNISFRLSKNGPPIITQPTTPVEEIASSRERILQRETHMALPKLMLVFLTTKGLHTTHIWDQWFSDAARWLRDMKWVMKGTSPFNFVQAVMTYHPAYAESIEEQRTPEWLTKDTQSVSGSWGKLLGVMYRGLEFAIDTNPQATYLILLSDTTVPLKSFASIVGEIIADPRSRFDIFCLNFWVYYFKHSQWIMLSRQHADWLLEDSEWTKPHVNWVKGTPPCETTTAATDEYFPGKTILLKGGGIQEFANINLRLGSGVNSFNAWTFVHWAKSRKKSRSKWIFDIPQVDAKIQSVGHPATFLSLSSDFLRQLVQKEGMWFLRKARDTSLVTQCSKSMFNYYTDLLHGPRHRPPEGRNDSCLLGDFLPLLWKNGHRGHINIRVRPTLPFQKNFSDVRPQYAKGNLRFSKAAYDD